MDNAVTTILGTVSIETINPLSFTHHGVKGLPLMTRGVDDAGRHLKTVYLPAAHWRGRIRHEATFAQLEREGKVKLETAYMLALGQDLRPEEDDEPELIRLAEQQTQRAGQPLLDLFGTWKLASRLMVSHLLPDTNVETETFRYIRRDLDSNEDLMSLLDEGEQDRFYDRQGKQSLASKSEALIKIAKRELAAARRAKNEALVDELEGKIAELGGLKKQQKGEDDSDNTKHLVEIEAIPAGVTLTGKMVIQRARPRDLGILIDALERISRRPVLGAHVARGCGEVTGRASFSTAEGEVLVVVTFGGYKPASVAWTDAGRAYTAAVEVAAT